MQSQLKTEELWITCVIGLGNESGDVQRIPLYTKKSGDNIGLVWKGIYMSRECQFEDVTTIHCTTSPHALGTRSSLSCLLAFYGIPYIPHCFNWKNFLFTSCH